MKSYIKIAGILLVATFMGAGLESCNDDYLERLPTTEVTDATAFNTYTTCSAYLKYLYAAFSGGYSIFQGPGMYSGAMGTSQRDIYSRILTNYGTGVGNINGDYAAQTKTIPTSSSTYSYPYIWIRAANILLDHLEDPDCTDEERIYLEAVARFFRAYMHYTLLINYGDIIYVGHTLTDVSEELTAPRDSRLYVADQIYNELRWCIDNIEDSVAEPNEINSDVVRAFMSRFALFEGTWRKYHEVDETDCATNGYITGTELLEECVSVSSELMSIYPDLYKGNSPDTHPGKGWGEMWTTEDLQGVPGVILYVKYVAEYNMHRIGHYEHIGSASLEMPQCTVDLYLTRDGLPIHNSGVKYYDYDGTTGEYIEDPVGYDYANCNVYRTFRNRDPRLWQTVMPPYHISGQSGSNDYKLDESNDGKWMEYLNIFAPRGVYDIETGVYSIPNLASAYHQIEYHKALPSCNWAGNYLPNVPNTQATDQTSVPSEDVQRLYEGKNYQRGRSGYFVWKHHACWDRQDQNYARETADKPLFKIEETLLNYAEAKWELGGFDQSVADATINKLRERAEVGKMIVGNITSDFDPDRDPDVDPVLWEIRRERLIELMGESFSWEDVRRWKKADWFVNKQHYGIYLDDATGSFNGKSSSAGGTGILNPETNVEATSEELEAMGNCGHLYYYLDPKKAGKGWLDKYYLEPIPSEEILLNENLKQQSGWE